MGALPCEISSIPSLSLFFFLSSIYLSLTHITSLKRKRKMFSSKQFKENTNPSLIDGVTFLVGSSHFWNLALTSNEEGGFHSVCLFCCTSQFLIRKTALHTSRCPVSVPAPLESLAMALEAIASCWSTTGRVGAGHSRVVLLSTMSNATHREIFRNT